MTRLRFPVSAFALGFAAGAFALPAFGQEAKIEDIQISQGSADVGGSISILVKLSGQPKAAGASQMGGALVVQIDGVDLPALAFDPAGNVMVKHVSVTPPASAAGGSRIRFEGAAFTSASTTIYRDAVLIEAKLAEASLPAGASLMANATPPKAPPAKPAPVKPAPVAAAVKPMPTTPVVAAAMTPIVPAPSAPVALTSATAPNPKSNALESHPAAAPAAVQVAAIPKAAAPKPVGPTPPVAPTAPTKAVANAASVATLAKLDTNSCAQAETQLKNDAWALGALGNHALCLIDQQKFPEAKNRLDQLAAFAPEDWRVEAGRAALAAQKGDASQAEIGYRNAAQLAPDEATRTAIMQMVAKLMGPAIN